MEPDLITNSEIELSEVKSNKQKSLKLIIVLFFITSLLFVFINSKFWISKPEPTPSNIKTNSSQLITSYPQSKSNNIDEFYVVFSAKISRNIQGYSLEESFIPSLPSPNNEIKIDNYNKSITAQQAKNTIYRVELIDSQGNKQINFTNLTYCPPNNDVCLVLDKELDINQSGYIDPLILKVTPQIQSIEVYVNNKLVKNLVKRQPGPKILSFIKETQGDGFVLKWVVDQEKSWVTLEYLTSENQWSTNLFNTYKDFRSYFIDPKKITSTLDKIDFRLLATDGLSLSLWEEKEFITASRNRDFFIELTGLDKERWIGQNANIYLDFIDPESGTNCGGEGCDGKYEVTWFSDKQNICLTDIYKGTLEYIFKKEGLHTIRAKIQHKEKPELKAEVSKQVLVHPIDQPFEDKNPNCSF